MPFKPGTIVVQYIDDTHTVIGVVVDSLIGIPMLKLEEASNFDPGKHHILLVIGWHGYADTIPMGTFGPVHVYMRIQPFPHLLRAKMETAHAYDFRFEIENAEQHLAHKSSLAPHPGLSNFGLGTMPSRLFRFFPTPQQSELLELVDIVQRWTRGDTTIPMKDYWKNYFQAEGKRFVQVIETLEQLLPRTV